MDPIVKITKSSEPRPARWLVSIQHGDKSEKFTASSQEQAYLMVGKILQGTKYKDLPGWAPDSIGGKIKKYLAEDPTTSKTKRQKKHILLLAFRGVLDENAASADVILPRIEKYWKETLSAATFTLYQAHLKHFLKWLKTP